MQTSKREEDLQKREKEKEDTPTQHNNQAHLQLSQLSQLSQDKTQLN